MKLNVWQWPSELATTQSVNREKLLFLHGMGGTGGLWRPIAASLEERFDIFCPDQRGHGKSQILSDPNASYTALDYASDVDETLQALQLSKVWVIGHSMGVRTSAGLVHLKPEKIKGLILVDLGFSSAGGGSLGQDLYDFLIDLPSTFTDRSHARSYLTEHCPDPAMALYLLAVCIRTGNTEDEVGFPFDQTALIKTLVAAKSTQIRPWILEAAQNQKPILVLRGAQSKVWKRDQYLEERELFKTYKQVTFEEFEGAGHGLPFEKRPQFCQRITQFVQDYS